MNEKKDNLVKGTGRREVVVNRSGSIYVMIVIYICAMSYLVLARFYSFNAGLFDLGIMEQVFWNTGNGRILTESVNSAYPVSRLWNGRWELLYLPISLIHRFLPHPAVGLIFQTVLISLGALPLYWMAREKFGGGLLAFTIPLVYLLYSPLHNANLFDIHGITFATSIFLFAFYYLMKSSWTRRLW